MFGPVRKKIIALFCITALIMSPSVSFAEGNWKKIKEHFKNCEIKVQGVTTEQWSTILNPKKEVLFANSGDKASRLTTSQKVLIGVAAVAVAGGIIIAVDNNDDEDERSDIIP